jgi:hypothetical protein
MVGGAPATARLLCCWCLFINSNTQLCCAYLYLSTNLSIYLSIYLPTYISIYLPTYISIYLPTYIYICRRWAASRARFVSPCSRQAQSLVASSPTLLSWLTHNASSCKLPLRASLSATRSTWRSATEWLALSPNKCSAAILRRRTLHVARHIIAYRAHRLAAGIVLGMSNTYDADPTTHQQNKAGKHDCTKTRLHDCYVAGKRPLEHTWQVDRHRYYSTPNEPKTLHDCYSEYSLTSRCKSCCGCT